MAKKPSRSEREHWAAAYGSDADFLDYTRRQPSILSGQFSEWVSGEGRNPACHHRTVAAGAGTAAKPAFSAYALTHEEHRLTHQHGPGYFKPPEWWQAQADRNLKRWVRTRYKTEDDRDFRD